MIDVKDKKVLVFGLGLLGGGVATTNWLLKHGAHVTITDLKSESELGSSINRIEGNVILHLGSNDYLDIEHNEIIVANPDVSFKNKLIKYAQRLNKTVANEATIFFDSWTKPIAAVTGTRGKTTTVQWTNHFMNAGKKYTSVGNNPDNQYLKILDLQESFDGAVAEISSFHLEFFDDIAGPDIAVITNIFQDHLNRYDSMMEYALIKSKIFKNQSESQYLILNRDDAYTEFMLEQIPLSKVFFFSTNPLGENESGSYYQDGKIFVQTKNKKMEVLNIPNFAEEKGIHNIQNLLASSLIARLSGKKWDEIQDCISTLPQIRFRQEIIYKNGGLTIINDTTATSPDGGIAALKRFAGPNTILITGGTDRELDFTLWTKELQNSIKKENIVFISGSATEKMKKLLNEWGTGIEEYETLKECLQSSLNKAKQFDEPLIILSPASKSFEKFKNEYDRGLQFNELVREMTE